ncbi:MAG: hypothetical protein ABIJ30_13565 [bacterium]
MQIIINHQSSIINHQSSIIVCFGVTRKILKRAKLLKARFFIFAVSLFTHISLSHVRQINNQLRFKQFCFNNQLVIEDVFGVLFVT